LTWKCHKETLYIAKLNQKKSHFYSFTNSEHRRAEQVLSGGWQQWGGEDIRKGCGRVNMVEYYTLMNENGKLRPVETIPGLGEGGVKESDGGDEFNYDIL
jgi:hypothetical protein